MKIVTYGTLLLVLSALITGCQKDLSQNPEENKPKNRPKIFHHVNFDEEWEFKGVTYFDAYKLPLNTPGCAAHSLGSSPQRAGDPRLRPGDSYTTKVKLVGSVNANATIQYIVHKNSEGEFTYGEKYLSQEGLSRFGIPAGTEYRYTYSYKDGKRSLSNEYPAVPSMASPTKGSNQCELDYESDQTQSRYSYQVGYIDTSAGRFAALKKIYTWKGPVSCANSETQKPGTIEQISIYNLGAPGIHSGNFCDGALFFSKNQLKLDGEDKNIYELSAQTSTYNLSYLQNIKNIKVSRDPVSLDIPPSEIPLGTKIIFENSFEFSSDNIAWTPESSEDYIYLYIVDAGVSDTRPDEESGKHYCYFEADRKMLEKIKSRGRYNFASEYSISKGSNYITLRNRDLDFTNFSLQLSPNDTNQEIKVDDFVKLCFPFSRGQLVQENLNLEI